jgi:hypothetical protein
MSRVVNFAFLAASVVGGAAGVVLGSIVANGVL